MPSLKGMVTDEKIRKMRGKIGKGENPGTLQKSATITAAGYCSPAVDWCFVV